MNMESQNSHEAWSDPDDAPELNEEFFEKGVWLIGDKVVSLEEARAEAAKRKWKILRE